MEWRLATTILALAAAAPASASPLPWFGPAVDERLEELVAFPGIDVRITPGNEIDLLVDGGEYYHVRLELIRGARATIDLQNYLWRDDVVGLEVARALAEAARPPRNVRVRIVLDYMNVFTHPRAYKIMRDAGIEILEFNPPASGQGINARLHEKVMIVDGEQALMGGANIAAEYMVSSPEHGPAWHDLELHIRGPVLRQMQDRFDSAWNWMARKENSTGPGYGAFRDPRSSPPRARATRRYTLYADPTPTADISTRDSRGLLQHQQPYRFKGHGERFVRHYVELVNQAKRSLVIYAPYFAPNPDFGRAILNARRKRKLDITLITNSAHTNDMAFLLVNAALANYRPYLKAGIRIFEIQDRTLHAKAMLIDETALTVGSHNFTHRSFGTNGEAGMMTDDPRALERFHRMADSDMARFDEVTFQEYMERTDSVGEGVLMIIGHWFERFF